MPWPFRGGEKQPPNQPPNNDDFSDAPDDETDPNGAAAYWAAKLGIKHTPEPDFDDTDFTPHLSWRERKIQQLGIKRFNELKIHSEPDHQSELAKLQGAIANAITSGQREYAQRGKTYPVAAVAILGSWAEGTTHTNSDLDYFILVNQDAPGIDSDFADRLRKAGIKMKFDSKGSALMREGQSADQVIEENLGEFAPHRIIVYA